MNSKTFLTSVSVWLLSLAAYGQGAFVYDQQSADESSAGGATGAIQSNQPIGQSFTPTLSSVGFIRLALGDSSFNNLGATVYVNLRQDSITGLILGSTDPVFMLDRFAGYPDFFFSTPVNVTPGVTYFFQPVVQSGDIWAIVAYPYNYAGGTAFIKGLPTTTDLWFREGIVVPEPSSAWLLLIGGGVFVHVLHRRIKKRSPLATSWSLTRGNSAGLSDSSSSIGTRAER